LATPVSYILIRKWLEGFEFSTEKTWWIFGAAGGIAIFITFITISYQTSKAAHKNPVEALRYE